MIENSEVTLSQMIKIIHRAINSVERGLLNHGEKVAYLMLNLLKAEGSYSEEEIINLCAISIFHDIGAYKVAEKDKVAEVDESASVYEHAIYGSLFIKYFSPLSDLYKVVLTHHFTHTYYLENEIDVISIEGLLLNFADYVDRMYVSENTNIKDTILKIKDEFLAEHIDLFLTADSKFNFLSKLFDGSYLKELYKFFDKKILTREEVLAYSQMLAYSIDFRSEATVKHTIIVEAISYQIGKLYGLNKKTLSKIKMASTLHDIGKIGIPVEILEKPGKLTEDEFEIMKSHAIMGYNILSDLNIDDIRDIGTLHHEKLDGAGYPFGLKENQLTTEMRIVAIGDIVSALIGVRSYKEAFSKEKIIKILTDMAAYKKIDSFIVNLFAENYDFIIEEAQKQSSNLMDIYSNLNTEFKILLKQFTYK
ncbi:HD-GYP domain-containing protein [Clostridium saccharoperbutylacetonicum]|uniref:HD-GYP domain-containing protein n=1 Tax=Clostridium saccharoperbutylacetonicum TaxID=36745 RepID=UPI000983E4FA|nr:HD domain-containing phosphohydrolase [Clostridium saccharoperbutylacetonicum]AQR95679.1 cyclic di-GMP phosphodiesterase response regulator RpfG [Clostridium saccharoperbutylacetonicum]NSB31542.1 HD-GYP domain-containing protein (c-di-GMP phosphodiesterase class II) [Clostridium saccharoperbutylacetonicum]